VEAITVPQTVASTPSRLGAMMGSWPLGNHGLKRYPHFDAWITATEAVALATNADRVASHRFYPFLFYVQGWNRFAKQGKIGKRKERKIRYAARGDAYIFAYYRHILSAHYEAALLAHNLQNCVLAYRKIPDYSGAGGKCNIHFARDAFLKICELGNCSVIALDISSFFENLDHEKIYQLWCRMLGVKKLPKDHLKVFQVITRYAVVNKRHVYERLGHFGIKRKSKSGQPIPGYLTPFAKMPTQLCTGKVFREKIAGGDGTKSLIELNYKPYGIPQGSPISDLLANLYLLDFDCTVAEWAHAAGGVYYRYSDDILIIVPGNASSGLGLMSKVQSLIKTYGTKLEIKDDKSSVFEFRKSGSRQTCKLVAGKQGQNGLEYLGFRFNGQHAYIRDSTLSNLYRKVSRSARREAHALARRYPDKDEAYLRSRFDYERLIKRFGRVEDFGEKNEDYRGWTFWTYARRASSVFGLLGKPILSQLSRHRKNIRRRIDLELTKAIAHR
jgi:hypothetical protein